MNDYLPADEADDVEAPFSVNFVTAAGFDRAQLTVRANDAVQLAARLGELEVNEVLDRIVEYNIAFQKKAEAASPAGDRSSGSPSAVRSQSAPQGAAPSGDVTYHPEGLTCGAPNCGQAVRLKQGVSKKGNAYKIWTCPNQKAANDGHFSEYIR